MLMEMFSYSVGINGTCSPSSHFFMCRPNSSSCGASFLFDAGGVRVGPRYFFGLRRTTGRRFCDASAAWRAARWPHGTLRLHRVRWCYARALYKDAGATLDDLREAVKTLEEIKRIAQRVFGGVHPITRGAEGDLRDARAELRARETPPPPRSA